ncbi:MAG: ParB/RepB/Spo0J family partition protein, partial [Rickettsiales bacterium]|nr:ParB/RepB/Spo0J family partition protein [Silvanigrellaceae bacterium]MBY0580382.1 ParB/RepB/Spo0J family partition protein [Rickettsiales bacterium]
STDGKDWEIIAGRRRWFACNHLGIKVRVKAIEANDRECAILMNLENKDRNDISEFEDAISYKQQLDEKLFDSQDEMASSLDLKKSKLSKMLTAAKIIHYPEIMNLFEDITLLKINPLYSLVVLLEKNNKRIEYINQKAKELRETTSKRKIKMRANVIIDELMRHIDSGNKINDYPSKNYKLGDKIILKTSQPTIRKIIFEFNKSNILSIDMESVKKVVLEALEEYI